MPESWTTWADDQPALSRSTMTMLEHLLGPLSPQSAVPIEAATIRPSVLPPAAITRLTDVLGPDGVLVDDRSRAEHSGGQSYVDIVRRRRGDTAAAPDAVLLPS